MERHWCRKLIIGDVGVEERRLSGRERQNERCEIQYLLQTGCTSVFLITHRREDAFCDWSTVEILNMHVIQAKLWIKGKPFTLRMRLVNNHKSDAEREK